MSRIFTSFLRTSCVLVLAAPAALVAQGPSNTVSVHGFVTQGYGSTNGEPTAGLTKDASANYHNATLQLVARLTSNDNLLLQFNNQHIGANGLGDQDNRFDVDWVFASHRFDNGLMLKVGKLPMPRGIYNEIREAGTILPFYRAPIMSYSEGYETVKGASLGQIFFAETPWELDATVYTGSWDSKTSRYSATTPTTPEVRTSIFDHTIGAQLWLSTPVEGLRVGLAGLGYHSAGIRVNPDSIIPSSTPTRRAVVLSLDGDFDRFLLRSEVRHQWYLESETSKRDYYYGQGGIKLPYGLSLNLQGEAQRRYTMVSKTDSTIVSYTQSKDVALGGRFALTPRTVFKLERHWAYGRGIDRYVAPTEETPRVTYMLASASFGF